MIRKLLRLLRDPAELGFRLRQEFLNLRLFWSPPALPGSAPTPPQTPFPSPAELRARLAGSPIAAAIAHLAASVREHRFPLLGLTIDTGPDIRWRRDYLAARETPLSYFRRIPYLDPTQAGDHKIIWELNRHQHLVLLAQDVLLHDNASSLRELQQQLLSWWEQNPPHRGINWTSALEVAFRSLSWLWIDHLAGAHLPESFRRRLQDSLYVHGTHLAANLSYYFSPNTHLLGEAVALHALGVCYPHWPAAAAWRQTGARVVEAQLARQVRADGSHFEQSSYYHVYTLDMFLFDSLLEPPSPARRAALEQMADYLDALLGPARRLPYWGDDDGGRFFFPFGPHEEYGRASLATTARFLSLERWAYQDADLEPQAAWWLADSLPRPLPAAAPHRSRFFPDSGLIVLAPHPDTQILFDAGPFGWGPAGHSHADTLSLTIRQGEEEILVDPGTSTYMSDLQERDRFRGTRSHNTLCIHDLDQASPAGPFAWRDLPTVELVRDETKSDPPEAAARCRYRGFIHLREVAWRDGLLVIEDTVTADSGQTTARIEAHWHLGSEAARQRITSSLPLELIAGERSRALGQREPIPVLRGVYSGPLPFRLTTTIQLGVRPAG